MNIYELEKRGSQCPVIVRKETIRDHRDNMEFIRLFTPKGLLIADLQYRRL